ncbi:hypothetical protein GF412_05090 [Candidatus Micrarchaeota archaeon]|nr:hypothetical protein [Candidatus Micrarchaeota archaeon]MBD3418329.1 hypothetical protein [Candidatus Micrarchaeota archaeon]
MKKKEFKFTANFQEDFAREVMERDAKLINEVTPGFQLPPKVEAPGHDNTIKPIEGKTMLSPPPMPTRKEKKEERD